MTMIKIINRFARCFMPTPLVLEPISQSLDFIIANCEQLDDQQKQILGTFYEALKLKQTIPPMRYFFAPDYDVVQHDASVKQYTQYLDICHQLHQLLKAYAPHDYGHYIHQATVLLNKVAYENH